MLIANFLRRFYQPEDWHSKEYKLTPTYRPTTNSYTKIKKIETNSHVCKILLRLYSTVTAAPSGELIHNLLAAKTIPTLHLLILWVWLLTFWPRIKRMSCTIHLPCLVMFGPEVFVLECWHTHTHTYTHTYLHIYRVAERPTLADDYVSVSNKRVRQDFVCHTDRVHFYENALKLANIILYYQSLFRQSGSNQHFYEIIVLSGACQVDVAVSTSSRHADLSIARRLAVARPKLSGRRSSSTVLSQVYLILRIGL